MSTLPLALAARLAKRGILNLNRVPQPQQQVPPPEKTVPVEEEIIAEDYDDHTKDTLNNNTVPVVTERLEADDKENKFMGHSGCPNKWNIHHECSKFCLEKWGKGNRDPDPDYERKRLKMQKKYPLPEEWKEVYDPGVGRYYYWNCETDEVSWLPPSHPRATISQAAAVLREMVQKGNEMDERINDDHEDEKMEVGSDQESEEEDEEEEERKREEKERRKEKREREWARGRTKLRDNDLDPMDPASYSDTPRGTWTTGLGLKNEAKTGADVTASGPLYQMRPYPSPGAVLRANAAAAESKKKQDK